MAIATKILEQLKRIDQVLMSNDPTVQDAFKQTLVLSAVAEPERSHGPLEQMFWEMHSLRREIEQFKVDLVNKDRGYYWSPKVYDENKNLNDWIVKTSGTIPMLDVDQIAELQKTYYKNAFVTSKDDNKVVAASPTDVDAFTMFDPDTGDSMSVKYK